MLTKAGGVPRGLAQEALSQRRAGGARHRAAARRAAARLRESDSFMLAFRVCRFVGSFDF